MKTTIITITILSLIMLVGIGCTNEKTELAWINDAGESINDIIWADGDQTWIKGATGYNDQEKTESKEVTKLRGSVVASILESGEWNEREVIIKETGSNSLTLNEGSSEVYTIDGVIIN